MVLDAQVVNLVMFVIHANQDILLPVTNVSSVAQLEHSMLVTNVNNVQASVIIAQAL